MIFQVFCPQSDGPSRLAVHSQHSEVNLEELDILATLATGDLLVLLA